MFLIAVMALMATAAATTWAFRSQREKELDLLFVGREYRAAIARYAAAHARERQPYPTALSQLLGGDDRLVPVRYLRRPYFDPMTGSPEWGLVRTRDGGITGVFSLSERRPIRTVLPPGVAEDVAFANAKTYRDWVFAIPVAAAPATTDDTAVPGWDYLNNGSPPPRWDSAHPQPSGD